MKKLFFTAIAAGFLSIASSAQPKKPVVSFVVKIPNALCENCKTRIETYLKRYDGVGEIIVNYRKGEAKIKYMPDRTDIEQIKTAIANAGYDADDVPATPDAYTRLPKSCKKFEDGGGHPKPKVVTPPSTNSN